MKCENGGQKCSQNLQIALQVVGGGKIAAVGIEYGLTKERVAQLTRFTCCGLDISHIRMRHTLRSATMAN